MILKLFLISILTLLPIQTIKGSDLEFYVAIDGSDAWDGTSPEHSVGTTVGPWETLSHAISEIRQELLY